jgi:hypothetical protein
MKIQRLDELGHHVLPSMCLVQTGLGAPDDLVHDDIRRRFAKGNEPPEDLLHNAVPLFVRELMAAGVRAQVGLDRFERTSDRVTQRNSNRSRPWDTRAERSNCRIASVDRYMAPMNLPYGSVDSRELSTYDS